MEHNEIYSVCMETGDAGAIYSGRDYSCRGNIVRYNFIHHTGGVGMGTMAVYNDDCLSGTLMEGNVFWKVMRACFLGGGRDFVVDNNVFVDCMPAVEMDSRGASDHPVWRNMINNTMRGRFYNDVNAVAAPYITRYPELIEIDRYYRELDDKGMSKIPPTAVITRNVCYGGIWLMFHDETARQGAFLADNWYEADPHFVDADFGNFALRADSPALALGHRPIDTDSIGPYAGDGRLSRPPRAFTRLTVEEVNHSSRSAIIRCDVKNTGTVAVGGSLALKAKGCRVESDPHSFEVRFGETETVRFTVRDPEFNVSVAVFSDAPGVRPSKLVAQTRVH